jgi:hypothetical protein
MKTEFNRSGVNLAYEKISEYERYDLYQIYKYMSYSKKIINGDEVIDEPFAGYVPLYKECCWKNQTPGTKAADDPIKYITKTDRNYKFNSNFNPYGVLRKEVPVCQA